MHGSLSDVLHTEDDVIWRDNHDAWDGGLLPQHYGLIQQIGICLQNILKEDAPYCSAKKQLHDVGLFRTGAEHYVFSDSNVTGAVHVVHTTELATPPELSNERRFTQYVLSTDVTAHTAVEHCAGEPFCACWIQLARAHSRSGPCTKFRRHDCDKRFGCAARNLWGCVKLWSEPKWLRFARLNQT